MLYLLKKTPNSGEVFYSVYKIHRLSFRKEVSSWPLPTYQIWHQRFLSVALRASTLQVRPQVFFFPLPPPLPLDPPLPFAPRPRLLPSNTDLAVTISPPMSLSSPELLLPCSSAHEAFVDRGAFFNDEDWGTGLQTEARGDSSISSDPRKPPAAAAIAALLCPSFCSSGLFRFAFLDLVGDCSSSSVSLSSPPSRSFLFRQVTALRSRWLWITCFSCCSMRKKESIRSWV